MALYECDKCNKCIGVINELSCCGNMESINNRSKNFSKAIYDDINSQN